MSEFTLGPRHYEAFGLIIAGSARVETVVKVALAAMMHSHSHYVHVLTAPYTSTDLYNVAKSLTKMHFGENDKFGAQAIELIGRYKSFSQLRNFIAHCSWVDGSRDDSIRPVYMKIREGRADGRGFSDDERDYTLNELRESALALFKLNDDFVAFIRASGLAANMDENTAETSKQIDSSDGKN